MRHIPALGELVERVDVRLRTIAAIVAASLEGGRTTAPSDAAAAEEHLTGVIRWLDRLADHNRHYRRSVNSPEAPIAARLQIAFDNAAGALRGLDEKLFRRRANLHSFDKSHAEGVFGCILAVGDLVFRAADAVATFDRGVFGTIYEKVLAHPVMPELTFVTHAASAETPE
ncbi:MAG: hypothetical protein WC538_06355 [Thermoanaerobaculia bacterium]